MSWSGALAVALPDLLHGHPLSTTTGILMFPAMLLGPSISGIVLTPITDGKLGLRRLLDRLRNFRVGPLWYALLFLPPALVLVILYGLKAGYTSAFLPNDFYMGILFALPAGLLEEIGWMGFAYPRMINKWSPLSSAIILGLLWSLWHLPVINFLGAAVPHRAYWLDFFLAFTIVMTAMRVLICWLYRNTESILMAQLMHISSTGALVTFSPWVSPAQEAMWYAIYGSALWLIVAVVVRATGFELQKAESRAIAGAF
jgi:membrane protease YdiL (CAAX protease family)